jgi:hypothetical protein
MRRNSVLEYGMMVDWIELEKRLEDAGFFEPLINN